MVGTCGVVVMTSAVSSAGVKVMSMFAIVRRRCTMARVKTCMSWGIFSARQAAKGLVLYHYSLVFPRQVLKMPLL